MKDNDRLRTENKLLRELNKNGYEKKRVVNITNNITVNANIIQLGPLTEKALQASVQHLTLDHVRRGPEGFADYALQHPLKDRFYCRDKARRISMYKDVNGETIKDPGTLDICRKVFTSVKEATRGIVEKEYNSQPSEGAADEDHQQLTQLLDCQETVSHIADGTNEGEKTVVRFTRTFVKEICNKSR